MLTDVAVIFIFGMFFGYFTKRIKLTSIVGMLLTGILLGPYVCNFFDVKTLSVSPELRKMALTVILLKAGLSLNYNDLRRTGRCAVLLCFLPASFEIIAFMIFGPLFLPVSLAEAALIGAVMGAVSPAVIVPRMSKYIDEGYGVKKGIPQMLIAGSSADDVYVIVIFSALLNMLSGKDVSSVSLLCVPLAITSGIVMGAVSGFAVSKFFKTVHLRDTAKVLVLISISFLFEAVESSRCGKYFSGLLAVMSMGVAINVFYSDLARRLTLKFGKIWTGAEILLFVLVGAEVNINYALKAGIVPVILLFIGLCFRLFGTWVCLIGTNLNGREKWFSLFSQVPKATVQAAIGGIPLAMGLASGDIVLSIAVISILLTAPLGALLLDNTFDKWLTKDIPES